VDTLTHALSGALLARALSGSGSHRSAAAARHAPGSFGPPVPVWQAVAVGLTAATFPDADIVLKWVSDLAYLRGHRGVTHSVLMLPLWAALLGALASLAFRRRDAWRRYSWLAAASIAIHIAGDWITQFGTMLLAPLSDQRFGLGSVFIIDLVLSGIIVAGLLGSALLPRSRLPAVAALALLPAWVGVTLVGKHEALQIARDYAKRHEIAAERVGAAPRPASPFNWTAFVFDGREYHVSHVNTRRSEPLTASADDGFLRRFSAPYDPAHLARWERLPKFGDGGAEAALAREVWEHPEFGFFRWFAMFPLVYAVERGESTCVWYRDLRFVFPGRSSEPFRFGMCRAGEGGWARFALDSVAGRAALR
jgi:inner membrane protein